MRDKVAVPASLGHRQAMPAEGFLAATERLDLDALLGRLGEAPPGLSEAAAGRMQVAAIASRLMEPELRPLLEWLLDITLRRPTFLAGFGPEAVAAAALREGQNQLVWRLLQAIAEGRGEAPPPREGI